MLLFYNVRIYGGVPDYGVCDFEAIEIQDFATAGPLGGTCESTGIRNTTYSMRNGEWGSGAEAGGISQISAISGAFAKDCVLNPNSQRQVRNQ